MWWCLSTRGSWIKQIIWVHFNPGSDLVIGWRQLSFGHLGGWLTPGTGICSFWFCWSIWQLLIPPNIMSFWIISLGRDLEALFHSVSSPSWRGDIRKWHWGTPVWNHWPLTCGVPQGSFLPPPPTTEHILYMKLLGENFLVFGATRMRMSIYTLFPSNSKEALPVLNSCLCQKWTEWGQMH